MQKLMPMQLRPLRTLPFVPMSGVGVVSQFVPFQSSANVAYEDEDVTVEPTAMQNADVVHLTEEAS